jgi:uncharacterized protein YndB with AHSA1/START domain
MATTNSGKAKVILPSNEQILIEREFEAPRHLVFRAWTTPELVKRWWSGVRGEMRIVEIDLRVGGQWRYVMFAHERFEVAFHGTFREIVPNERIVTTEVFEQAGVPEPSEAEAVLNIVTFVEQNRRTKLSLVVQCPNQAIRDVIVSSGMEAGLQEQMDVLEELLRSSPDQSLSASAR